MQFRVLAVCLVCVFAACELTRAEPAHSFEPVQTVTPEGEFSLLTLTLQQAVPNRVSEQGNTDCVVQFPLRDGRLVRPTFAPELAEGIGHVIPPAADNAIARIMDTGLGFRSDNVSGEFQFQSWGQSYGGAPRGYPSVFDGRIDLKRDGTSVSGSYSGTFTINRGDERSEIKRDVSGNVSGTWFDADNMDRLPAGASYPSYYGHGDFAMPASGAMFVEDASLAKLVWRSEEWLPCGPGTTSRVLPMPNLALNGNLGSPVYHDGTIYVSYFMPSGDVMYPRFTEFLKGDKSGNPALERSPWVAGDKEGLDPLAHWITSRVGQRFADDVLVAIDAATGRTKWRLVAPQRGINTQGHKGSIANVTPVYADGKVFFSGSAAVVYAVDANSGKILWIFEPPVTETIREAAESWHATVQRRRLGSPLMVADGVVVSLNGLSQTGVVGVDARSGKLLWESPWGCPNRWEAPSGNTYLLMTGKGLACIDPKTGEEVWQVQEAGGFQVDGNYVSVHGNRAVLRGTHKDLWTKHILCFDLTSFNRNANGVRGEAHDAREKTQDARGPLAQRLNDQPRAPKLLWTVEAGYDGQRPMSIADGRVFLTPGGRVLSVDLETGEAAECQAPGHNTPGGWFADGRFLYRQDGKHGSGEPHWIDVSESRPCYLGPLDLPMPPTTNYEPQITVLTIDGRTFHYGKDGIYCFDFRDPDYAAGKPAARLRLAQDSQSHPASGERVVLVYEGVNADRMVIEPGGHVVTGRRGTLEVTVDKTTTFTLTASGAGGKATAEVTVPVVPAVQLAIASRATTVPGVPVTLTWKAVNTEGVEITPDIGAKLPSGSLEVAPQTTTTYTIQPVGGNVAREVTVEVLAPSNAQNDTPRGLRPGLLGTLWTTSGKERIPDASPKILPRTEFGTGEQLEWDGQSPEQYRIKWSGYLRVPSDEIYSFAATAGIRLFVKIDGKDVLQPDGHGVQIIYRPVAVPLAAGLHPIEIELQYWGASRGYPPPSMNLTWARHGEKLRVLSGQELQYEPTTEAID